MGMNLFFQFFAGIPMEETDQLPLLPLGRWILPVGIYILMSGFYLGADRKNRRFVMVRYVRVRKWWKNYFLKNMLYGGLAAVSLLFLGGFAATLTSQKLPGKPEEIIQILLLWTVHGMMLLALFLVMDITKIRNSVPAVLLLLEGMTFLYGYRNKMTACYMFGTWGMYAQSSFYDCTYGFSAVCVIGLQLIGIAGCYILGSHMLMKKEDVTLGA